MKNNALLPVTIVLALALAGAGGLLAKKPTTVVTEKLGAISGPDISSPHLSVNGVETHYFSSGLNQASTTLCSFKLPNATTTITHASAQIDTGTTTVIVLEWGHSAQYDATTTSLGLLNIPSGAKETLVASSTGAGNFENTTAGPDRYLNLKYGGALGAQNALVGRCRAEAKTN